jgi:XTP/dITP diphosphohydrolase
MPRTLYVASSNPGKLRDFATAAEVHSISVAPLPDLENIPAPEEDGATFEDNARIKAAYYSGFAPGELVIADDSGLEVDALDGEPGVRSARFAADAGFSGPNASTAIASTPIASTPIASTIDQRNNLYLLHRLASHIAGRPTARYRCVIAAARNGQILTTTEGSVDGEILSEPRGTGGFGYDPLFFIPELGKTMAEIDLETKHSLSHRGKAFFKLLQEMRATGSKLL